MIGSTGRRWKLGIIAGAGMACLGAGPLLISGCSTATVSDSRTTGKSNQQVAKAKKPASGKNASKQVVAKGAPGKVKISDLNDQQRDFMAGQVAQNKAAPQNRAVAKTRAATSTPDAAPSAAIASNGANRTPAAQQRQAALRTTSSTPQTVAQRRSATGSQAQPRANVVASNTRASTSSITQTSGDRSATASVTVRPPMITPRKTEWKEEGARETAASNHERRRADRLMQRASAMYASGYREEALRLASVAAELEYSQLAVYKRGEERPSDFVEFLLLTSKANRPYSTIEVPPRSRLQPADPSPSTPSSVVPATAESTRSWTNGNQRKATGDVLRTEASGLPQAARDLKPASSVTPRFATADAVNSRTAANAGQLEVPVAQAPRKADVSVVTADGNGVNPDEAATAEESQSVVTADQVEESDERASSPGVVATRGPAPAAVPAPEAEIEPPVEADAPAVSPHNRSQLTIASLIGLVAGVGGMVGLGWWRRQERQHYAAGK